MLENAHHPLTIFDDFRRSIARPRLWGFLARREIARQYDRTFFGVLWIPLNVLLHVGILGFLFSVIYSDRRFVPYFALGYSIWTTFGRGIHDAATLWPTSEKYLRHMTVPISLFVVKAMFKEFMVFAMSMPVGVMFCAGFGSTPTSLWLLAIPGILIYFANLLWMTVLVSIFALRYRDIAKFIPNALFICYLATPILWEAKRLGEHQYIALFNPFFHIIELVRSPFLNQSPMTLSWLVALGTAVVGNLIALGLLSKVRKRIVLWL